MSVNDLHFPGDDAPEQSHACSEADGGCCHCTSPVVRRSRAQLARLALDAVSVVPGVVGVEPGRTGL